MKLGLIASPGFSMAFNRLMGLTTIPIKTLFKLKEMDKIIVEKSSEYEVLRNKLIFKHARKTEDGKIDFIEKDQVFIEDMAAYDKELQELNDIDIKVEDVPSKELGENPALSGKDLKVLTFIVE